MDSSQSWSAAYVRLSAAEIGTAWAVFVRGQVGVRKLWPRLATRAAAIARRLVEGLAAEPRRGAARLGELAP